MALHWQTGCLLLGCRNICTMVAYDDICNRVLSYNSLRQHMLTHVLAYARTHKCIPGAI